MGKIFRRARGYVLVRKQNMVMQLLHEIPPMLDAASESATKRKVQKISTHDVDW